MDAAIVTVDILPSGGQPGIPVQPNLFGILVDGVPAQTVSSGTAARFIDADGGQVIELQPSSSLSLQGTAGPNMFVLPGNSDGFAISRDFADIGVTTRK